MKTLVRPLTFLGVALAASLSAAQANFFAEDPGSLMQNNFLNYETLILPDTTVPCWRSSAAVA